MLSSLWQHVVRGVDAEYSYFLDPLSSPNNANVQVGNNDELAERMVSQFQPYRSAAPNTSKSYGNSDMENTISAVMLFLGMSFQLLVSGCLAETN